MLLRRDWISFYRVKNAELKSLNSWCSRKRTLTFTQYVIQSELRMLSRDAAMSRITYSLPFLSISVLSSECSCLDWVMYKTVGNNFVRNLVTRASSLQYTKPTCCYRCLQRYETDKVTLRSSSAVSKSFFATTLPYRPELTPRCQSFDQFTIFMSRYVDLCLLQTMS